MQELLARSGRAAWRRRRAPPRPAPRSLLQPATGSCPDEPGRWRWRRSQRSRHAGWAFDHRAPRRTGRAWRATGDLLEIGPSGRSGAGFVAACDRRSGSSASRAPCGPPGRGRARPVLRHSWATIASGSTDPGSPPAASMTASGVTPSVPLVIRSSSTPSSRRREIDQPLPRPDRTARALHPQIAARDPVAAVVVGAGRIDVQAIGRRLEQWDVVEATAARDEEAAPGAARCDDVGASTPRVVLVGRRPGAPPRRPAAAWLSASTGCPAPPAARRRTARAVLERATPWSAITSATSRAADRTDRLGGPNVIDVGLDLVDGLLRLRARVRAPARRPPTPVPALARVPARARRRPPAPAPAQAPTARARRRPLTPVPALGSGSGSGSATTTGSGRGSGTGSSVGTGSASGAGVGVTTGTSATTSAGGSTSSAATGPVAARTDAVCDSASTGAAPDAGSVAWRPRVRRRVKPARAAPMPPAATGAATLLGVAVAGMGPAGAAATGATSDPTSAGRSVVSPASPGTTSSSGSTAGSSPTPAASTATTGAGPSVSASVSGSSSGSPSLGGAPSVTGGTAAARGASRRRRTTTHATQPPTASAASPSATRSRAARPIPDDVVVVAVVDAGCSVADVAGEPAAGAVPPRRSSGAPSGVARSAARPARPATSSTAGWSGTAAGSRSSSTVENGCPCTSASGRASPPPSTTAFTRYRSTIAWVTASISPTGSGATGLMPPLCALRSTTPPASSPFAATTWTRMPGRQHELGQLVEQRDPPGTVVPWTITR